jgi:hypothetical protein
MMLNEFLDILKDGYTVEFSENNTLGMTEVTVAKYGKSATHSINLDHLREFGLTKETVLLVVIRQLIADIENRRFSVCKEAAKA